MLRFVATAFASVLSLTALVAAPPARALGSSGDAPEALGFERTPPRLSFADGEVSFLRIGAEDWAPALVNMPLATGDELAIGDDANVEVQIGARMYLRAGEQTELGVSSLEPDFLQFRLTRGVASLDVRSINAGHTLEIDTPNAAFTIEHAGYYRIEVDADDTIFISRRGGHATVTPANGESAAIEASEQLVITGLDDATLATYAAPELNDWDRWNYARTDQQLDAVSSRYVPLDVYGADDLDHNGSWRVVRSYGSVWVPRVALGWSPYSAGSWIRDPYYGWSWVDDAPWGWAPFHYGRWVRVGGYWAWSPGPRVVRAYYSPALVAFYGSGNVSFSIGFGSTSVAWIPLGWGEPVVPWWGPPGCRGVPRWTGWRGPRVVNNVVVKKKTVVNVADINIYSNHARRDAMVVVDRKQFGQRNVREARHAEVDHAMLKPIHDADLGVEPSPESFVGTDRHGRAPKQASHERTVVARRAPQAAETTSLEPAHPRVRVAPAEPSDKQRQAGRRPPFGQDGEVMRTIPPEPPRFEDMRHQPKSQQRLGVENGHSEPREMPRAVKHEQQHEQKRLRSPKIAPRPDAPEDRSTAHKQRAPAREKSEGTASKAARELPGEPANRVFRVRSESRQLKKSK